MGVKTFIKDYAADAAPQSASPADEAQLNRDRIAAEMLANQAQVRGESGAFIYG